MPPAAARAPPAAAAKAKAARRAKATAPDVVLGAEKRGVAALLQSRGQTLARAASRACDGVHHARVRIVYFGSLFVGDLGAAPRACL